MKRTIITLAIFLFLSSAIGTPQEATTIPKEPASENSQKTSAPMASFVFRSILPTMLSQSRVPPMLPSFLPGVDEAHPVYALSPSIDSNGYEVVLAVELPCEGEHRCLYGSVRGSRSPFNHTFNNVSRKVVPIKLHKDIKGGFIDAICDTYCTEAYAEWKENGYYYSIGMKAGREMQLVKMANSAIDSGYPDSGGR